MKADQKAAILKHYKGRRNQRVVTNLVAIAAAIGLFLYLPNACIGVAAIIALLAIIGWEHYRFYAYVETILEQLVQDQEFVDIAQAEDVSIEELKNLPGLTKIAIILAFLNMD